MNTPETTLSLWASLLQTIPSRTKNPALYCSGCHLAFMCFFCLFVCFCLLMLLYSVFVGKSEGRTVIVSLLSPCVLLTVPPGSPLKLQFVWLPWSPVSFTETIGLWPLTKLWLHELWGLYVISCLFEQHRQSLGMDFFPSSVHSLISSGHWLLFFLSGLP